MASANLAVPSLDENLPWELPLYSCILLQPGPVLLLSRAKADLWGTSFCPLHQPQQAQLDLDPVEGLRSQLAAESFHFPPQLTSAEMHKISCTPEFSYLRIYYLIQQIN